MIVDVQINAMLEGLPIVVNDKTGDCDRLVGIEFGLGTAQILLSMKNASILQKKLLTEITRQKAEMAGEGAIRLLSRLEWVKKICVRAGHGTDDVIVLIETDTEISLELKQEVGTIGALLTRAVEAPVTAHVMPLMTGGRASEVEVYSRPENDVPVATESHDC